MCINCYIVTSTIYTINLEIFDSNKLSRLTESMKATTYKILHSEISKQASHS